MGSVRIKIEEAKQLTLKKLIDAGLDHKQASKITEVLIHADVRGVSSHGILRLEHYINRLKKGGVNGNPEIKVSYTGPVTAIVDGDNGFGHIVADKAMEVAMELAKEKGVGMIVAYDSSHCGALSYYVKKAADEKLIGIVMSQTDKIMVPYGGKEPFLGTNPIAFGVPANRHKPFILDMATSTVALGKIFQYQKEGKSIPLGWGVDKDGEFVTDPNKVVALTPFGGPKGYGLALIVDIFSGLLAGTSYGPHVRPMYRELEKYRKLGHYFCVINPSSFTEKDTFLNQMDRMIDELHNSEPNEKFEKVYVPGDIEYLNEEKNEKEGIIIPNEVYQFLLQK